MKKVLTILVIVISLASGMKVSIDHHYCGGQLADVRISLSGKLASCGMEPSGPACPGHQGITSKCCEDQVSVFSINNYYYPQFFKLSHPVTEKVITALYPANIICSENFSYRLSDLVLPPGNNLRLALTQPEICVFRI